MPVRYLLDEHLRGGALWQAIKQHNARGTDPLDVVRLGDPSDLPLGTLDPDILLWAERQGRVFISLDKKTLARHLRLHLQAGHHSPGVFIIRAGSTVAQVMLFLTLAAYAGDPASFHDRIEHIP